MIKQLRSFNRSLTVIKVVLTSLESYIKNGFFVGDFGLAVGFLPIKVLIYMFLFDGILMEDIGAEFHHCSAVTFRTVT